MFYQSALNDYQEKLQCSYLTKYGCIIYLMQAYSIATCICYSLSQPNTSELQSLEEVETGYRLPPPPGCPRAIYRLMMKCWYVGYTVIQSCYLHTQYSQLRIQLQLSKQIHKAILNCCHASYIWYTCTCTMNLSYICGDLFLDLLHIQWFLRKWVWILKQSPKYGNVYSKWLWHQNTRRLHAVDIIWLYPCIIICKCDTLWLLQEITLNKLHTY